MSARWRRAIGSAPRRRSARGVGSDPIVLATLLLVGVALVLLIALPVLSVVGQSLRDRSGSWSPQGYLRALRSPDSLRAIRNTLTLGTTVATVATVLGLVFAYWSVYVAQPGKGVIRLIALLPLVSPPFGMALAVIVLFGNRGLVTRTLLGMAETNVYGFPSLLLVQVLWTYPLAFLLLEGALRHLDPALEEASRNLGASRWQTFRRIVLPLALPALATSFILVFIKSVSDVGTPLVIGGGYLTLATQTYLQIMGSYDLQGGAALATLLLGVCVALFAVSKLWLEQKGAVTLTGRGARAPGRVRERRVTWPLGVVVLAVSAAVVVLYAVIPLVSFTDLWGVHHHFTLRHYASALETGWRALWDSCWLSLIATAVAGLLSMVIAFLVVRRRFTGRAALDFCAMLAIALPGSALGIGYLATFNSGALALTGTAEIIIMVLVARALPVGVRAGVTSLLQIDPSIEEAAADLGADTLTVFTTITLPLLKSAFFSSLLYAFIRSMTAVTAVIFLVSASHDLLTVRILNEVAAGRFGVACAFFSILIVVVYGVIFLFRGLFVVAKLDDHALEVV